MALSTKLVPNWAVPVEDAVCEDSAAIVGEPEQVPQVSVVPFIVIE